MPSTSSPPPTQRTANTSGWRPGPGTSPLTLSLAALFLLPFVVLGLSMLLFGVGPKVVDWVRAQSWQATPAVVESAATIKEPGHKGGTAYGVEVRYRYEVDGKVYWGQRASLHEGGDNVNSFQQQLGESLEAAQRSGSPVQAWVNPAQPAESVADRSLRLDWLALQLIVALGFSGFGMGMWWVLLRIWLSLRLERQALKAHPTQRAEP
jgi:hypothetical protein